MRAPLDPLFELLFVDGHDRRFLGRVIMPEDLQVPSLTGNVPADGDHPVIVMLVRGLSYSLQPDTYFHVCLSFNEHTSYETK